MSDHDHDQNLDYEAGTASVVDMHDAVKREKVLQPSGHEPMGVTALVLCAMALIGGGIVFGHNNGFSSSIYVQDFYTPEPPPSEDGAAAADENVAWIDKWMKDGKKVYNNCIACHQPDGLGAPGQFPPLVGSEWVDGGTERLGAIMLNGIAGPFTVAGQSYNQAMPAWNGLSDEKIAQVVTYIRREFGTLPEGQDGVVTTEMIEAARELYGGKPTWDEGGLLAIPEDAMLPGAKVDLQTGEPIQ
ncbi:MAG: cytochrome c [Verrucomicrobiales bacterium]|nr:cytochrome c [Verrucomicrobiales bacterium]